MNPTLLLLLLIVATAAPVATPAKCEASPEVKAKLAEVTRESEALDLSAADSASLVKRLQSIADQYPNDAYAQHALAHMRRRDEPLEPTLAAYRERAATGAPMQLMLYGEVLTFTKGAEAVELLTRAIKADPTLAPAYLALAVLYGHHPTLMSKAKLKSTIDAYVKLCPQSLLGYDWVAEYASQPQMALAAKTLRTKLANRADDEAMNAYEALWRLEFAATSMADQAKVRARVSTDADALAKLENPGRFALTTLNRAYVLAGREADSSRREEQIFKRFPKSRVAQQHLSKLCTPLASPVADDALPEQVL